MAPKTYIPTAMATEMKAHYLCSATECRKELQNAGVTVHQDLSLAELRVTLREHRLKTGLLIKRSAGSDTMAMIKRANKKELEVMAGQRELKVPEKASVGELRLALRQAVIDNSSGETQMEIGKHQGATFMEILNSDYQYARWAVQEIQTSDNPDWRLIQFARWVSRMEKQEEPVEVTPLTTSGVKEMFQASQNQPQAGTPLAYAATVVKPNQNIHLTQPGKKKVQVPLDTEVPTAAQRGSSSSETGEIKEMLQQMMLKMHTMESELKEVKEGSRFLVGKVLSSGETANVKSGDYIRFYQENWQQYFGHPEFLRFDAEGTWMSRELDAHFSKNQVMLDPIPGDAHWHLSPLERSTAWLKELLSRLAQSDAQIAPHEALAQALATWNQREMVRGFSPYEHALGQAPDLDGRFFREEVKGLPIEIMETPIGELENSCRLRMLAEETFIRWQAKERLNRALNSKSKTIPTYLPGELVFWALLWLLEQLRKASEREQTLAEFDKDIRLPWAITDIVATLRKNEYDDITQEAQQMPGEEGRDKVARFWLPPTKRHKTKGPVEKPPDNDEEKGDADVEMEGGHSSSSKSLEEIRRDKAQDWDGQLLRDQVEEAQNPQSFLSESKASVELNIPLPKSRHGWMKMSRDPLSFIVNTLKKKSVEVFEKHMDEETKEKFRGAKDTEINKFLRSEALECLPAHLQPSKAEAMSMRRNAIAEEKVLEVIGGSGFAVLCELRPFAFAHVRANMGATERTTFVPPIVPEGDGKISFDEFRARLARVSRTRRQDHNASLVGGAFYQTKLVPGKLVERWVGGTAQSHAA
ncbi:Actinidain [Durusdinium trenchii]|uniref:Actinidain n=1 Tax=Durusdinium trenchii TaxID=1381693 RepID=A0ABP0SBM4_9DINO